jgi:LacI family transcriptional regulator
MPPERRVALLFDPLRLTRRQRLLLAGVRRYADGAPGWLATLDPDAYLSLPDSPHAPPFPYHGLIALGRRRAALRIAASPVPAVVVSWRAPNTRPLHRVLANCWDAGRLAAEHLLDRGYRTFACVALTHGTASRRQREGFAHWLRWRGHEPQVCRISPTDLRAKPQMDTIRAELNGLLDRLDPPAGIFVTRDDLAHTLATLARQRHLALTTDLGIIGSGNDPAVCENAAPPLSSIEHHFETVGYRAAECLDQFMDGQPPPKRNTLISPTLVPRRSTDRQGTADPAVARALAWIDARRTLPMRPEDVAHAVGLGLRQLQRRMADARGHTVVQEITLARVEHAKLLLETEDAPLNVIARECGFRSRPHLSRAFRKHLDTTPTAWRRDHKRPPRPGDPQVHIHFDPGLGEE